MSVYEQLRKEYADRGIQFHELAEDPFDEFDKWFQRAVDHAPSGWLEVNAMTLSTCDDQGHVSSRTVLLKQHNREGFLFFTNYDSEKGRQLEKNPQACCLFHWAFLGQQVRFAGPVSKTNRQVSAEYFHSRPRQAQISALASPQSAWLASREELEERVAKLTRELDDQPVPLPDNWGGYCLQPTSFEFWQGRLNRLHDRVRYDWDGSQWQKRLLAP